VRSGRARRLVLAAITAVWMLALSAAAFAQGYPGGGASPSPTVKGTKFYPGDDNLPRTGTDVLLIILIALTVLLMGFALHRFSQRAKPRDD